MLSFLPRFMKIALVALGLAALSTTALARPGCVGKMWNPLTDLDFRLMGGIKILGIQLMKAPAALGEPPNHKAKGICFCVDGLDTGFGLGLTFWMPSYINDVARQAGCLGFLNGINILPGFISQSSGQEYAIHSPQKEGATNMQIHWAYADVLAIVGKSVFEKCDAVSGQMKIAYLTEPDFVFQNDVYSAIMSPQVALLASVPLLSQMTCAYESIANTLGDWQDWGVCAWKGGRLPLSGTSMSKDMAQVTNMDVVVKYLTRSALIGTTLRTMGRDATCHPKYSPFYDPFQHRYQWAYPGKASTRFNIDVIRWGLFIKDTSAASPMTELTPEAEQFKDVDTTGTSSAAGQPADSMVSVADDFLARLAKPLNYPTKEAGYMQVWEARQCCLMVLTIESAIKMILKNIATSGSGLLKELYEFYNIATTVYQVVTDPVGAAMGYVGGKMMEGLEWVGEATGATGLYSNVVDGIKESFGGNVVVAP